MRRIRITLSYDGTDYHGWQVQPGLATIQGVLEGVLAQIEGDVVHVDGSGRTDAGVHALAQVGAFRLANPIPLANLKKAMNRLLPRDIRVTETADVVIREFMWRWLVWRLDGEDHKGTTVTPQTHEYRVRVGAKASQTVTYTVVYTW